MSILTEKVLERKLKTKLIFKKKVNIDSDSIEREKVFAVLSMSVFQWTTNKVHWLLQNHTSPPPLDNCKWAYLEAYSPLKKRQESVPAWLLVLQSFQH